MDVVSTPQGQRQHGGEVDLYLTELYYNAGSNTDAYYQPGPMY
jgi:hypothetical protein